MTDDLLGSALLDPGVRKRRVVVAMPGVFVDVEALIAALRDRGLNDDDLVEQVDAYVERLKGHRLTYALLNRGAGVLRSVLRTPWPRPRRAEYWIPMSEFQRIRRSARPRHRP